MFPESALFAAGASEPVAGRGRIRENGEVMPMPVIIHDASIDYDVHGDGPALLLIGGLGLGRWGWFKQIPALSRHFRHHHVRR